VADLQYIESSVIGIRSAVITLRHRVTPLRFVLIPMVHVAEPRFFREVADLARTCALIVAEAGPSRYAPMQAMMARIRWDHLVDQIGALDLEALGVPVQWEYPPDDRPKSGLEQAKARAGDAAAAVVLRALGRYGSPLGLPSLDQADEHDDRWEPAGSGPLGRIIQGQLYGRDSQLVKALTALHAQRQHEPVKIAVVFGAAHIPAVVDCLAGKPGYYVENAQWLMVASAPG
jgi:hypothetical protein